MPTCGIEQRIPPTPQEPCKPITKTFKTQNKISQTPTAQLPAIKPNTHNPPQIQEPNSPSLELPPNNSLETLLDKPQTNNNNNKQKLTVTTTQSPPSLFSNLSVERRRGRAFFAQIGGTEAGVTDRSLCVSRRGSFGARRGFGAWV